MFSRINFVHMPYKGWMKILLVYQKMNEIVSLTLSLFPTPLGGFFLSFFIFLWWLLHFNIVISNKYVHFRHHFFTAHVLFNVGGFVICMLPLPYPPNYSIFFILQSFCEIIVTLPSIQLPSVIASRPFSSCTGKEFGVLRKAINLLAQTEESKRRNPNNPHIEVML